MESKPDPQRSTGWKRIIEFIGPADEEHSTRLFFYFLVVILFGLTIWGLAAAPNLKKPVYWIPFVILSMVHLALHWSIVNFKMKSSTYVVYLIAQGALVFAITGLSGMPYISYGLYMALIGEAIGIFRTTLRKIASVGLYLILSYISYRLFSPEPYLLGWLVLFVPMTLFVVIYVNSFINQLDARAEAQKLSRKLEKANRQLSAYAAQIEQLTLAAERQRIARELHDSLSAGLAGTILQLEAADSHLSTGNKEKAQVIIKHAMERAREALADARRMIDQLRSGKQPGIDIPELLRKEASRLETSAGIHCEVGMDPGLDLSPDVSETVYRILCEGIANIERHSEAHNCWLGVHAVDSEIEIDIRDDGVGFDPESGVGEKGHYGLVGLRERARLAGGKVEIESQPGKGTALRIAIPEEPWAVVEGEAG